LGDAAPERSLGTTQAPERGAEVDRQHGQIIRAPIGQGGFRPMPDALIGVQLGGVRREEHDLQPGEGATDVADRLAAVDPAVVPQQHHRPAEVTQQVAKEGADLEMVDVGGVELVVEADMP
jgi:hypothetical protein